MTTEVIDMSQTRPRVLVAACGALLVAGCSAGEPTSPPPASPVPVTTTTPNEAALSTYREFWRIVDAAGAAPQSQDWTPKIKAVATGQAQKTALTDIANYASLPAHLVGTITRDPKVASATSSRVSILDCVDLGTVHLVSDRNGVLLDDTKNRVERFHLRADVIAGADGRWLVSTTAPALNEPC
jgi:predicted signal transduction protein with EAL and GGDEF domain